MRYFARKVTKRQLQAKFGSEDGSFGDALAKYLNDQKAEVISVIVEGSEVTTIFLSPPDKGAQK